MRIPIVLFCLLLVAVLAYKDKSESTTERVIHGLDELESGINQMVRHYDKFLKKAYKSRNYLRALLRQLNKYAEREQKQNSKVARMNENEKKLYFESASYFVLDRSHIPLLLQIESWKKNQRKELKKRQVNYCRNRHPDCDSLVGELREIDQEQQEFGRINKKMRELIRDERSQGLSDLNKQEVKLMNEYIRTKADKLREVERLVDDSRLFQFNLFKMRLRVSNLKKKQIRRLRKLNKRNKSLMDLWGDY